MKHLLLLLLFFCIALPLSAVQYGEGADIVAHCAKDGAY